MLNSKEIIGFPEPSAKRSRSDDPPLPNARFDLVDALRGIQGAEIARISDLASRLNDQFGPEITVGFLYYEILGRAPDGTAQIERLRRAATSLPSIIEELIALVDTDPKPGRGLDPAPEKDLLFQTPRPVWSSERSRSR
jgi:hypothetical protein